MIMAKKVFITKKRQRKRNDTASRNPSACQKSPVFSQKSPVFYQDRGSEVKLPAGTSVHVKEIYILPEVPNILPKEPCI